MNFIELGIREDLTSSCIKIGWQSPTDIQQSTIPVALTGVDIIGLAETGSGKTGAFLLPILNDWLTNGKPNMFSLILTPTRELASQIEEQFKLLGTDFGLKTVLLISGEDMSEQIITLGRWDSHIVIATPGRIVSMLAKSKPARTMLETIKKLVIDEADRMLHLEFESDMESIAKVLPKRNSYTIQKQIAKGKQVTVRQTMMFSATFSTHIEKVASFFLYNPQKVSVDKKVQIPKQLKQSVLVVQHADRMASLFALLRHYLAKKIPENSSESNHKNSNLSDAERKVTNESERKEMKTDQTESPANEIVSAIVFVTTCKQTRPIETYLNLMGASAVALHSQLSQSQREQAISDFREGVATILVATDIASRGIDVDHVQLVVNLDLPQNPDWYKHRVGRTARNGRQGTAVTIVTELNQVEFVAMERRLKLDCPMEKHPSVTLSKRNQMRSDLALKEARKTDRKRSDKLEGIDTDFSRINNNFSAKRQKLTEGGGKKRNK